MNDINQLEAFSRYHARPCHHARSAVTEDGVLVVSCWYSRFHRAEHDVLRYEEDLSADKGTMASTLRSHLAEAVAQDFDVRLVIAITAASPAALEPGIKPAPVRVPPTTFYARKDLIGRVTFFDGQRFIIEFRKELAN